MSKSPHKIAKVAKDLKKSYPDIQVKEIEANFYKNSNVAFYQNIYNQVKDLDISIVITNAAILRCGYLTEKDAEIWSDQIDANSYHYVMMQKLFIHKLLERTKQGKRCALMGTSSRLGTTWNSIIKVYSASKSVTYYLGCALSQELKALPSPLEDGSRPDLIDYQAFVAMGIGSNLLTSHWYF